MRGREREKKRVEEEGGRVGRWGKEGESVRRMKGNERMRSRERGGWGEGEGWWKEKGLGWWKWVGIKRRRSREITKSKGKTKERKNGEREKSGRTKDILTLGCARNVLLKFLPCSDLLRSFLSIKVWEVWTQYSFTVPKLCWLQTYA